MVYINLETLIEGDKGIDEEFDRMGKHELTLIARQERAKEVLIGKSKERGKFFRGEKSLSDARGRELVNGNLDFSKIMDFDKRKKKECELLKYIDDEITIVFYYNTHKELVEKERFINKLSKETGITFYMQPIRYYVNDFQDRNYMTNYIAENEYNGRVEGKKLINPSNEEQSRWGEKGGVVFSSIEEYVDRLNVKLHHRVEDTFLFIDFDQVICDSESVKQKVLRKFDPLASEEYFNEQLKIINAKIKKYSLKEGMSYEDHIKECIKLLNQIKDKLKTNSDEQKLVNQLIRLLIKENNDVIKPDSLVGFRKTITDAFSKVRNMSPENEYVLKQFRNYIDINIRKPELVKEHFGHLDLFLTETDHKLRDLIDYDEAISEKTAFWKRVATINSIIKSGQFGNNGERIYILTHNNLTREAEAKKRFIKKYIPDLAKHVIIVPFSSYNDKGEKYRTKKSKYIKDKYLCLKDGVRACLVDDSASNINDFNATGDFVGFHISNSDVWINPLEIGLLLMTKRPMLPEPKEEAKIR